MKLKLKAPGAHLSGNQAVRSPAMRRRGYDADRPWGASQRDRAALVRVVAGDSRGTPEGSPQPETPIPRSSPIPRFVPRGTPEGPSRDRPGLYPSEPSALATTLALVHELSTL